MTDSILLSIKKMLGLNEGLSWFDDQIIIHINSVLASLNQLGIGPKEGYSITSENEKWDDLIGDNKKQQMVSTYMYLKVRLLFDPPASSTLMQSINDQIRETEYRLTVESDNNGNDS